MYSKIIKVSKNKQQVRNEKLELFWTHIYSSSFSFLTCCLFLVTFIILEYTFLLVYPYFLAYPHRSLRNCSLHFPGFVHFQDRVSPFHLILGVVQYLYFFVFYWPTPNFWQNPIRVHGNAFCIFWDCPLLGQG